MKLKCLAGAFLNYCLTRTPFHGCMMVQVRLGKNGLEEVLGLGSLSDYEKESLENLKPELKTSIEKGFKFANQD